MTSSSDGRTPKFDTWESYFYPETMTDGITGTLRNIPGYRDEDDLKQFEYHQASINELELRTGAVPLPRTYDADHLRAIHRHMFKGVYEWAGEYRSISMQKDATRFAELPEIDRYLMVANKVILDTDWPQVDRKGFADATAEIYANINQAHPFREGNGRAGKLFMQQVAELSSWRITYDPQTSRITPQMWNQQSMLSAPDFGKTTPDPKPLLPVFYNAALPATAGPVADLAVARVARVRTVGGPTPDLAEGQRAGRPDAQHASPTMAQNLTQQHRRNGPRRS